MGRAKRKESVTEIHKPDPALAVKIYREDIRPAMGSVGEFAQEMSTGYKAIKKQAHIQPQAAKLAFKLDGMEEAKRDDFLRCFRGLLTELHIFMPKDMLDAVEGKGGEEVIPTSDARPKPKLVTVPKQPPADDSDLAGDPDPDAAIWGVVDRAAKLYIDDIGKDWAILEAAGKFTKAAAEKILTDFEDDAEGLEVVDITTEANDLAQAAE